MRYWEVHQIKKAAQRKAEEDRQYKAAIAKELAEQPELE